MRLLSKAGLLAILALMLPVSAWAIGFDDHVHAPACKTCGGKVFGTSVEFVESPSVAAQRAKKEEKLVFVLHVSGHFEDPGVT